MPQMEDLLSKLLILCVQIADPLPSPSAPAGDPIEKEADEWVLRGIRGQGWETPSPELACALVPRLRYAKFFGSIYESGLRDPLKPKDDPEEQRALLEVILLEAWHETGKPEWIKGTWQ